VETERPILAMRSSSSTRGNLPERDKPLEEAAVKLPATMYWSVVVMWIGGAPKVHKHYSDLFARIGMALGAGDANIFAREYEAALAG